MARAKKVKVKDYWRKGHHVRAHKRNKRHKRGKKWIKL